MTAHTTIIFLRHGEAEHNVAHRENGEVAYHDSQWRDANLSSLGHEQALMAGEDLARNFGTRFQAIWSSPLSRCIQTALDAQQSIQTSFHILHDSLLERLGGGHVCNERADKVEIVLRYPGWETHLLPREPPKWGDTREPLESVRLRMKSLLLYLVDTYRVSRGPILVVTHHDAIEALFGVSLQNGQYYVYHEPEHPHA